MDTLNMRPSQTRREIINLNEGTFMFLSIMAEQKGMNLKNLIEEILDGVADGYDDNKIYEWLVRNVPDGTVKASDEEKADFENWLGV